MGTPSNMKQVSKTQLWTAPADMSKSPGYIQRAMVASMQSQPAVASTLAPQPTPPRMSPLPSSLPLATPSPSAAAFYQHPGSTLITSGFAAALSAAGSSS